MKICCVFNYNPLYRLPIYKLISQTFDAEFYFGDFGEERNKRLKSFDPNQLNGFKGYHRLVPLLKGFMWSRQPLKLLKRKYDVYLLTGDPSYLINWIIILFAKLFGKDIYCWCHGPKEYVRKGKTRIYLGLFYKSMNGILMYNSYNCKYMTDLGIPSDKLHVIHNSLDTHLQTHIYDNLSPTDIYREYFKNPDPVVIFIGRIQKRMKVQYLIEAQDRLLKKGVTLNVVLVGPYLDGADIRSLVASKGLTDRVWFYGESYDEMVNSQLLYNADVCVAPGTVGLTAIHTLSYGTPCITHNNFSIIGPEFEAIKDGVTGTFFEEDDIDSLTDKICQWIGLSDDDRLAVRANARKEIVQNWSVDYQIYILKKVFNEGSLDN